MRKTTGYSKENAYKKDMDGKVSIKVISEKQDQNEEPQTRTKEPTQHKRFGKGGNDILNK